MGLTKQYLAYRPVDSFNIITSARANVNFITYKKVIGRYALVGAAENAIIWDLRFGERALTLRGEKKEVTALRASPDCVHVAIGYANGVVQVYDLTLQQEAENAIFTLALHKSAVTVLRYENSGVRLVSGGLDTEVVVSDMIQQAGQQRLSGHSGAVTDAHFLERFNLDNIVISCSKDMQIKIWNLQTKSCFKTIVDNRTEVWAIALIDNFLIAGCSETNMNVYKLEPRQTGEEATAPAQNFNLDYDEDLENPLKIANCGVIERAGKGRIVNMSVDATQRTLSFHGTDDLVENIYFRTEQEAQAHAVKRIKKIKKLNADSNISNTVSLADKVKRLHFIKTKEKVKSIDVLLSSNNELRVLIGLAKNSIQLYSVQLPGSKNAENEANEKVKMLRALTQPGHQSEVRAVAFTSDSLVIGSGSANSFKLWNRETMQCLRTAVVDYVLCCAFAPGDRYILLGLKSGKVLIMDAGSADIIEEVPAHESEVWSIVILPNLSGCITGGSDKTVKIWSFEMIDNAKDNETNSSMEFMDQTLSMLHKSELKFEDAVLCLHISNDHKYLAVGLLDATVKVFYFDTFKFYLSLYGHKLQVLCLDISYDSQLIVTGSADRNIKIWGLDFGDCRHSLFAHDDTVVALQFIPKTHMFFSCGKDGKIKQWDADNFQKILTLPGHIGEAYNLAISPNGKFLVTCGSDRTLRLFERTDEPLVLEEVQEQEREEIEREQFASTDKSSAPLLPGLRLASERTMNSQCAVESLLECLKICTERDEAAKSGEEIELHPLMRALSVDSTSDLLLVTLTRIRAADLEEALLLLPYANVVELLQYMPNLFETRNDEFELLAKVTIFLFKLHMKSFSSSKGLKTLLKRLLVIFKTDVVCLRDVIGYNLHGLKMLQQKIEEQDGIEIFEQQAHQVRNKHKKKSVKKRAFIQVT